MIILTTLAFAVLTPNLILFSTDDLDIYRKSGDAGVIISQAGIGRYTFHSIGVVFRILSIDYTSYLVVSTLVFSVALAFFFRATMSILEIEVSAAYLAGYLVFLTCGLNLDLFQYQFAYLQYGAAFLCAGGVLWVSHRVRYGSSAIAAASILSAVGLGAYQLFAQIIVMTIIALCLSACLDDGAVDVRHLRRAMMRSLVAMAIGAALYLAINASLKGVGVPGYASYPVRAQGLAFARANISAYLRTLLDLVEFSRPAYRPLLPEIWRLLFLGLMLCCCVRLGRKGVRSSALGGLVLFALLVVWPNPANLFLADYWPSARSMAGFSVFFGVICSVLFDRSRLGGDHVISSRAGVVAVLACQCVLMAIRYQDRFVQQEVDVALAQAILLRAYAEFSIDEPVSIDLAIAPGAVQTVKPVVYDYGRSMFATSWSAPALLDHLSGHRASARVVGTDACSASAGRLNYERRGGRLLVCLLAP